MIEDIILTKKKFAHMVEHYVQESGMAYMDSILKICADRDIDPQDVGKLISPVIKDKLEAELIANKTLKGGNQLPL